MDAPDRPAPDAAQRASRRADGDRAATEPAQGGPAVPAALLERVAERLRPVRGEMDAERFDELVRDVASFIARWGEIRRPPP